MYYMVRYNVYHLVECIMYDMVEYNVYRGAS
jgi:hypothetical protein